MHSCACFSLSRSWVSCTSMCELALHSNVVPLALALSSLFCPLPIWCSPISHVHLQADFDIHPRAALCLCSTGIQMFHFYWQKQPCGVSGPMRIVPIYTEHHLLISEHLHLCFFKPVFPSLPCLPCVAYRACGACKSSIKPVHPRGSFSIR
jgi:hypothetical protein